MSDDVTTNDAEQAVLGSMMLDPRAIDDATDIVESKHFAAARHSVIYEAIVALHTAGDGVDPLTVADALSKAGDLARVGGAPYLHTLYSAPATAKNASYYAKIVRKRGTMRQLEAAAVRIRQMASSDGDPDEAIEAARGELDACLTGGSDVRLVGERIDESLSLLETTPDAIPTPWRDLNHLIHGWLPGALYIVGARPGVGKSIAAVQAALGLSDAGYVAFSSLEMSEADLHFRMVAALAEVPLGRLIRHELTPQDWTAIARHRADLGALRISIDDSGYATPITVRSHARSVARKGPLSAVIVDYMQLLLAPSADSRKPRHEQVSGFSRSLKLLAKELQVPVIALAQLNRGSETRTDRRPVLADLRESGSIEQDADVVLLLHEDENDETNLQMLVAKNRRGQRGPVDLVKRGWYSRLDTPGEKLEREAYAS